MARRKQKPVTTTASLDRAVAERVRRGVGVSTAERVRQAGERELDVVAGVQRISQAPLDRMYARGELARGEAENKRLFDAGDRFREDAYLAGAIWPQQSTRAGGRGEPAGRVPGFLRSERAAAAMRRHVAALETLSSTLESVAMLVCLGEGRTTAQEIGHALGVAGRRSATVAGMTAIRLALGALADHYFGAEDDA